MCFIHRYRTFWVIIFVLLFAACAGREPPAAPVPPPGAAPVGETPTGGAEPGPPGGADYYSPEEVPGLADYFEKCQRLNRDFEEANIVYSPTERMRRENSQIIEAAATLRTEVPPQEILKSEEVLGSQVRVSCVIEAELRAAEVEFDIQEQGWQSRSLLTSPTARWTWSVTPNRGGNHELVLAVRPVIALEDESGNPLRRPDVEASTLVYRIMVDVSVPPDEWLGEGFDRTTSLLASAKGMVGALTALVVAITALAAIRWRRAKSRPNSATPIRVKGKRSS